MVFIKSDQKLESVYIIYSYDKSTQNQLNRWQRHSVKTEMIDAFKYAEALFHSGQYHKVEIIKKFFDQKKNKKSDMLLKTFESKELSVLDYSEVFFFSISCGVLMYSLLHLVQL